jgi:hypothetical protein
MSDEFTTPPVEPAESTVAKVVEGIQVASGRLGDAIETSRRPGMPLGVLASMVREAPLAALGIAFMIGVVFATPRRR